MFHFWLPEVLICLMQIRDDHVTGFSASLKTLKSQGILLTWKSQEFDLWSGKV